jgi:hypothetical protein
MVLPIVVPASERCKAPLDLFKPSRQPPRDVPGVIIFSPRAARGLDTCSTLACHRRRPGRQGWLDRTALCRMQEPEQSSGRDIGGLQSTADFAA